MYMYINNRYQGKCTCRNCIPKLLSRNDNTFSYFLVGLRAVTQTFIARYSKMGSSASADDKSMRSQPDNKARSHSPATQKHTANESGEKDSLKNYRDVSNGDAKRKALNKTNKIHASNIQVEQSEGPMIALHNGTNEKLEIEQESANEIKKNRKKNQHQNDLDQAAMEEKYREEEAKRNARIGNLKDQLRRRVDEIRNTYDSVEVEFDTIQDLETDIKHLQKANNYGVS